MGAIEDRMQREIDDGARCANAACQRYINTPSELADRRPRLCMECSAMGVPAPTKPVEIRRTSEARHSSAEICRRNRWTPGTQLVASSVTFPPYGLQITAVGLRGVLAFEILPDGTKGPEMLWDLTCRDWLEFVPKEGGD